MKNAANKAFHTYGAQGAPRVNADVGIIMIKKITAMLMAAFFCTSCGVMDILGPRDKPDFQNKDWTAITIMYWVNTTTTNKLARAFTVTDASTINGLKTKMNIKGIHGLSVGTRDELQFQDRNGDIWQGSVVFENRIHLSKKSDNWYSYAIDFTDYNLFNAMLALCVQNERTFHPNAKPENIILRRNIIREYPVVEE